MQEQDIVKRVISRKTARGTMAYTLELQNGGFIGAGFDAPQCDEGDQISYQWETNQRGYKQIIKGSINVIGSGPAPAQRPQQANSAPVSGGGATKQSYWEEKEKRDLRTQGAIQYQASRNAAIQVATAALQHDCISLGTKKAEKADILLAFIDELTDRYNKDVTDFMDNGARSTAYDGDQQDDNAQEVGEFDQ